MKSIFIILGYGIPKDIFTDENYNIYLKSVFNKIYDQVITNKIEKPLIICSGGPTDIVSPFRRTEAGEMVKFLKKLSKKKYLKDITKDWEFVADIQALSTLENFLNCKEIIKNKKKNKANIYIFGEHTRNKRLKILASKIFDKNFNTQIITIDFDTSLNRYLDPKFIQKKETEAQKIDLKCLKSGEELQKNHEVLIDKIKFLRKFPPEKQADAIKKYWDKRLKGK